MNRTKLTVKELFELKGKPPAANDPLRGHGGKRQLTVLKVSTAEEASACEAAGIDMINASERMDTKAIRLAAPNTFLAIALPHGKYVNADQVTRGAFDALQIGADAVYSGIGLDSVEKMAKEGIPVIGHVGFIPYKSTWFGGFKAVGKTAEDALKVHQRTQAYENAGAIGVEMELVPFKVAAEIARRVRILCLSMGSGNGCDGQFLYASDILGKTQGHVPRHAKVYRNFKAEYERLQQEAIAAFREFKSETETGVYPEARHTIEIRDDEYTQFLASIS